VRSPPLHGGKPSTDGLTEEGPETTREAVFPEGCTLCVRKYGPDASPGISFPPHASKMTRRPSGNMCRLGPSHPCGRAEPAPPGGQAHHGWPYGGRPGDDARGGFLGGTHSVRPQIRAGCNPGHLISTTCVKDDPGTLWGHVSVRPKPSLRACGARPSTGGKPSTDGLTEEGPRCQGGFPGGTHSVRPRGAAPRMARHCVATGAFSIRRWPKRGQCWG